MNDLSFVIAFYLPDGKIVKKTNKLPSKIGEENIHSKNIYNKTDENLHACFFF